MAALSTVISAVATTEQKLQVPHGGKLVNLMLADSAKEQAVASCSKELELSDRNACDVELLCVGAFSPLEGFMSEQQYLSVVQNMRLPNDLLFGLPVVLDTNSEDYQPGDRVLLKYQGQSLAVFTVESKWVPNKPLEAKNCYGTTSIEHPAVQMISMERGKYYMGGKVEGLELPKRVFPCATPAEVRATLPEGRDVLAFQCRNPIHRAHYELFIRALDAPNVSPDSVCLVHPTCGPTQDDDIPGIVRYHTYEVLKKEVNNPRLRWAYLPYSMHMAGPREAIQHMIIRKNYGCTHFIIGRDMAGCKSTLSGEDFYGPYDAQDTAKANAKELGMDTVPSLNITYTEEKGYVTADVADAEGLHQLKLSGTKFRKMLRAGEDIPEWFAFKSVVDVLRNETSN
ncbi:ATP sulfurylase [Coccomyxa subellipsoidea C-169]|uniref:sulfate adenylyltransferase n=1 Tax=Coccomyxa subellipsoidea (strain C-169) TaxID=574566 RepID=I0YSR8_COCSC|nr:ATP sulfurylase [Coccomyxa subellipsoidea C-169]EIE21437.1 ATP sulfurylase [Coccomyxa subellipsoidea C-169]|eukprot:XP_005645981.1 ATP sulfurylase [Coccomyxa subellipsoidea C-169]